MYTNVGDCFVVLSPHSETKSVIYGRNSYRPEGEVQEIIYFPANENSDKLKCDNIEIDGVPTLPIILSKTPQTWGGESGANEHGVCIGISWTENETKETDSLLATDLTRLGLERSSSAVEAVNIIGSLTEQYGTIVEDKNSVKSCFVVCDIKEVWLINVVGNIWAAEQINDGFRSISQGLSIKNKVDKSSENLEQKAQDLGLWDGTSEFNFCNTFSSNSFESQWPISEPSTDDSFSVTDMFEVLRKSSIEDKTAQSSHVSTLTPDGISCHWFTGTPNPVESVFKPFIFTPNTRISPLTKIPDNESETILYKLHSNRNWDSIGILLRSLELTCVDEVKRFLNENPGTPNQELDELMKDCVEAEVKFYR